MTNVTIELPETTVQALTQVAEAEQKSLTAVVETLLAEYRASEPRLPADVEAELLAMANLSSDILRLVANTTLTLEQQTRLEQLNQQAQTADGLPPAAQAEREALLQQYDRVLIRRATALDILHARGDVRSDLPNAL